MNENQRRANVRRGRLFVLFVVGALTMHGLEGVDATAHAIFTLLFLSTVLFFCTRLAWSDIAQIRARGGHIPVVALGWACGLTVVPVYGFAFAYAEESTALRSVLRSISVALMASCILLLLAGGHINRKRGIDLTEARD